MLDKPADSSEETAISNESETEEESRADESQEPEKPTKSRGGCLWAVLILLLILAILGGLGYFYRDYVKDWCAGAKELVSQYFGNKQDTVPADTLLIQGVPDTTDKADTTLSVTDTLAADTTTTAVEPAPTTAPVETPALHQPRKTKVTAERISFETGKFYVVHGSFTTAAACQQHIRLNHFNRFNPSIVSQAGSNRLRVCLGVFNSEAEAQQFLTSSPVAGAWILK